MSLITGKKNKKQTKKTKNPHDHLCQGMGSLILEVSPTPSTPSAFRHSIFVLGVTCRSVHKTPGTMCVFPSRRRSKEALPCWPLCESCIWLLLTGMRLWERERRPERNIESSLKVDTRRTREVRRENTRGQVCRANRGGYKSVGHSSGDTHGGAAASGSCPSMACF